MRGSMVLRVTSLEIERRGTPLVLSDQVSRLIALWTNFMDSAESLHNEGWCFAVAGIFLHSN